MSRIVAGFEKICMEKSSDTAIIYPDSKDFVYKTYAELHKGMDSFAEYLISAGVRKGDKILLFTNISYKLVLFMLASIKIGAVIMFVDINGLQDNPDNIINRFSPDYLLVSNKTRFLKAVVKGVKKIKTIINIDKIPENIRTKFSCESTNEDDTALLTMTTGSTGNPKMIPRSHGDLLAQLELINNNIETEKNEVILTTSFMYVFSNIISGYTTVLSSKNLGKSANKLNSYFEPFQKLDITMIMTTPDFALKVNHYFPKLRTMYFGGAIINTYEANIIINKFRNANINYIYGSTECNLISKIRLDNYIRLLRENVCCLGNVVKGVEIKTEDEEIFVSSKALLIKDKHWHGTGDSGYFEDDCLYYLGRKKFSFMHNGKRIYYNQIEQYVNLKFSNISKCAFLSENDEYFLFIEADTEIDIGNTVKDKFGINVCIKQIRKIPKDVKHHTKVDYKKLQKYL